MRINNSVQSCSLMVCTFTDTSNTLNIRVKSTLTSLGHFLGIRLIFDISNVLLLTEKFYRTPRLNENVIC